MIIYNTPIVAEFLANLGILYPLRTLSKTNFRKLGKNLTSFLFPLFMNRLHLTHLYKLCICTYFSS